MNTKKVILYIALSLDGYIADKDGGVAWLEDNAGAYEGDYGYGEFYQGVHTVIMGYKTYDQIVNELSPDKWFYTGRVTYVLTHRQMEDLDEVKFTDMPVRELMVKVKEKAEGNIWICGGGEIVRQFMEADLIEEFHLTIMPKLLGSGVRLFGNWEDRIDLELVEFCEVNGAIDCVYRKKQTSAGGEDGR